MKKSTAVQGVKEQVLKVPGYTLRAAHADIKLNQNESPYDFPETLKDEILRRFRNQAWSRYPDFVPEGLRQGLADFAGWKPEGILVGNGSNELLLASLLVLVRERSVVAVPSPTFTVYGLVSRILGGRVLAIPMNGDMSYNAEEIVARAGEAEAKVLILCNPNNPTGSVLEERDIELVLERFSGYTLLDEAYYEFCGRTGLRYLPSHPRLIITRTFSKAMGMAGLRVGYMMAHPDLVTQIAKAKLPYSVNQFSILAAQVALENLELFRPAIDAILSERARVGSALRGIPGVKVYPTGANFFLFEVACPPRELFDLLQGRGVLVRDVSSYPMISQCLRVSIGTPEENDRFLDALRISMEHTTSSARRSEGDTR